MDIPRDLIPGAYAQHGVDDNAFGSTRVVKTRSLSLDFQYPKVLDYTSDITIGRGVAKGEDVVRDMSNAKVILKRNGQGWFYVLTAYPTK